MAQEVGTVGSAVKLFQCPGPEYEGWTFFGINDSKFAILHKGLKANQVNIPFKDWNVILAAPVIATQSVEIRGKSVIVLDQVESSKNKVTIIASDKYIHLGPQVKNPVAGAAVATGGFFQKTLPAELQKAIITLFLQGLLVPNQMGKVGLGFAQIFNALQAQPKLAGQPIDIASALNFFQIAYTKV
jgi:hypothetical protein